MSFIHILGRQPALGLAELESLLGSEVLTPIGDHAVLSSVATSNYNHIGGTQKVATLLQTLPALEWRALRSRLSKELPSLLQDLPEGKIKFGISVYGYSVSPAELNATGLELKKVIKRAGRSARIIANKETELNSAQVLHGGLLSPVGIELVIVRGRDATYLSKTIHVQDIDAYAARDQQRPARDSRVGMLPPKLAQTIINLAIGNQELGNSETSTTILDPFCGTGVVLQEALLMGIDAQGSDLEPRMIDFTNKNLSWLKEQYRGDIAATYTTKVADATSARFAPTDTIACETYLGRPLSSMPDQETLSKIMNDCHMIHKKFLQNVARQTQKGFRMCLAVPAWHTKSGVKHLKTLENLEALGYTRMSFVHVSDKDLVYHRTGQVVGRELVVLTRK